MLVISITVVVASSLMLLGPLSVTNLLLGTHGGHSLDAQAAAFPLMIRDRFTNIDVGGDAAASSKSLNVNENFVDPEHHCEFCTRLEYHPGPQGAAGYAYKDKAGLDLSGAKKASFWVMGEAGGEKVRFELVGKDTGGINRSNDSPTKLQNTAGINSTSTFKSKIFALTTQEVTLNKDWKKYEVDLTGLDLKGITSPFAIDLFGKGTQKQVVYLKGLIYDDEPAKNAFGAITLSAIQQQLGEPMTARIISNATKGSAPATFELKANVSGGTGPYAFKWNFDDGASHDDANILETKNNSSVIHTFTIAKDYNVTLGAIDALGQNASDNMLINVGPPILTTTNSSLSATTSEQNNSSSNNKNETNIDNNNSTTAAMDENKSSSSTSSNSTDDATLNSTGSDEALRAPSTVEEREIKVSAGGDIMAQPGDTVAPIAEINGADNETDNVNLKWTQSSGPKVEIHGDNTLQPRIDIPRDIDKDTEIHLKLSASLGSADDTDSMTVFVIFVDEVKGAQEKSLDSTDTLISQWEAVGCDDLSECLSDDSKNTFSKATPKDAGDFNAFSFDNFDIKNAKIEYVTAIATAKAEDVGHLYFVGAGNKDDVNEDLDDQLKSQGSISISSDSYSKYKYIWKENPITGDAWTADSLNSFVAGYGYSEGKSSISVSEFNLVVTYTIEDQEQSLPADVETDNNNSTLQNAEGPPQQSTNDDAQNNNDTSTSSENSTSSE